MCHDDPFSHIYIRNRTGVNTSYPLLFLINRESKNYVPQCSLYPMVEIKLKTVENYGSIEDFVVLI